MKAHIKSYFVCPHCQEPLFAREDIKKAIDEGKKFCGHCGKEIATALAEAIAEKII